MTKLRIASWNLQGKNGKTAAALGRLLAEQGPVDVVLLQEASRQGFAAFTAAARCGWGIHLKDRYTDLLRVTGRAKGADPYPAQAKSYRCVAMAGAGATEPATTAFPELPAPEKAMAAWMKVGGLRTTLVTFHSPNAAQYGGPVKAAQANAMARWLARIEGPVILGGDFNTPAHDHFDLDRVRVGWPTGKPELAGALGEDTLVGPRKLHRLEDALRSHLASHPELDRTGDPLRVSHTTKGGAPVRYDAVWLSPHFTVTDVQYRYAEAKAAGTDHALVLVDAELQDEGTS